MPLCLAQVYDQHCCTYSCSLVCLPTPLCPYLCVLNRFLLYFTGKRKIGYREPWRDKNIDTGFLSLSPSLPSSPPLSSSYCSCFSSSSSPFPSPLSLCTCAVCNSKRSSGFFFLHTIAMVTHFPGTSHQSVVPRESLQVFASGLHCEEKHRECQEVSLWSCTMTQLQAPCLWSSLSSLSTRTAIKLSLARWPWG